MKKMLFAGLVLWCSTFVLAKSDPKYNENPRFKEVPWSEEKQPLPPFPEMGEDLWQEFYVNEQHKNTALLHLQSISVVPNDFTIRYVLNIKTPSGVNNISAEGLRCTDRLNKVMAYADTVNQRWIENKRGEWASIDSSDAVRLQIRYIFCDKGTPKDHNDAVDRVFKEGGKFYRGRTESRSTG